MLAKAGGLDRALDRALDRGIVAFTFGHTIIPPARSVPDYLGQHTTEYPRCPPAATTSTTASPGLPFPRPAPAPVAGVSADGTLLCVQSPSQGYVDGVTEAIADVRRNLPTLCQLSVRAHFMDLLGAVVF